MKIDSYGAGLPMTGHRSESPHIMVLFGSLRCLYLPYTFVSARRSTKSAESSDLYTKPQLANTMMARVKSQITHPTTNSLPTSLSAAREPWRSMSQASLEMDLRTIASHQTQWQKQTDTQSQYQAFQSSQQQLNLYHQLKMAKVPSAWTESL